MLEAVRVALDPTPMQEAMLFSHAGAARFAFNAALAYVREMLEKGEAAGWSLYELRKWWNAHKDTLAPWWRQNSKEAYNTGLESLSRALSNWAASRKGKRKGPRMGFPKFRSKDKATPRFAYTTGSFGLIPGDAKALRLPRIGRVHCMEDVAARVGDGRALRMTIARTGGRWFASLTVERPDPTSTTPPTGGDVGVDLGVKSLATLSDGTVVPNPRTLDNNERRLAKAQRALSHKQKGSKRRRRARERVARLHAHVANQRRDVIGKMTTWLASTFTRIGIEDLGVKGMAKNHRLAKAIMDASFGEVRRQLTYKCARTGAMLRVIDRWFPSSKTCSSCGRVKAKLPLNERTYRCEQCGLVMDRDLNAAINIKVAGSAPETLNARGAGIRPATPRGGGQSAVKREPSGHDNGIRLGADGRKDVLQARTN